jgi:DoxX-like family
MLAMSAFMKLSHSQQIVDGFSKIGLTNYIDLIGGIEIVSVLLLWIPKTEKIGFLLLNAYLGGAISIELATGQFPTAAVILAVLWIALYLKERVLFVATPKVA